jgi:hypothetical protein
MRVQAEVIAAVVIQPHFDAVRDFWVDWHRRKGTGYEDAIAAVDLLVDPAIHDKDRHFMATIDTGKRIYAAPEAADLPVDTLVAILCHEFGHVDDLQHPGRWMFTERERPAVWLDDHAKSKGRLQRRWLNRNDDVIEWTADAIAYSVTGKKIGYCGPCLLQCFGGGGEPRPEGLR